MPRTRSTAVLALLLAVAAAVRLGLLLREWPASNSDEATFGLMAMHIAEGRRAPAFMDGQSYMGTAQSWLAAVVFRVAGPSLLGLRIPMLMLFLLFLVVLFVLARRLYGTGTALVSVGLLTFTSRELYCSQLVAQGAMPETLLGGAVLLLLGYDVLSDPGRAWRFAAWGATAALGLWSTALVAPFVLASGALVVLALRRRPDGRAAGALSLGGGLLVGALPWLLHDLTHPWRESGVVGVVDAYLAGGTGLEGRSPGLVTQLTNTLTTSLAYATGGSALAHPLAPPAWPYGYSGSWRPPTDDVVATLWGVGLVALWLVAVAAGVRALRRGRPARHGEAEPVAGEQVRGRLAMLAAAGLTVAAFAVSPTPGVAPANNVRYLVGVLVATPGVVAPVLGLPRLLPSAGRVVRAVVLGVVALSLLLGTGQAYRGAAHGRGEADVRQVLDALQRNGTSHVYAGYLDCNRLTFLSREDVVCATVFGDTTTGLRPGFDRWPPYRDAVRADPLAAYVLRTGDVRIDALARTTCRWLPRTTVAGYQIWRPAAPCPPPSG